MAARKKATPGPASVMDLAPNPRNPRTMSDGAREMLAKSLAKFGDLSGIIFNRTSGQLVGGHQRVQEFMKLGDKAAVTIEQRLAKATQSGTLARGYVEVNGEQFSYREVEWDEKTEAAANIAANKHGGEFDFDMVGELIKELGKDFDFDLTGFSQESIESFFDSVENEGKNTYTRKIISPVYTPKGDRPKLSELSDSHKTEELKAEIKKANLPEAVAQFLTAAADRHTVFNFRSIAEYYCHADKVVQNLMEKSGLVIIDFKKAIENGFVHMTERLSKITSQEEAE